MIHHLNLKVYIAGPMTGLPDFNYPAFNKAAEDLAKQGLIPLNPTLNKGKTWLDFMRGALRQIAEADCLYMLKDWQNSKGASAEHTLAKDIGLPIFYENELKPKNVNRPESPDIIAAATKEVSPGVKEGWTAGAADVKAEARLAEKVVNAARCSQLSPDHPSTGTDIPKVKERYIVAGLDVFGHWIGLGETFDDYGKAEKAASNLMWAVPGLPVRALPVKSKV